MPLIGMREMLGKAYAEGYAVGGFDGFESLSIMALLAEAKEKRSPALMICAPGEYAALGPRAVAEVARVLSGLVGVDACLHLDHANTYEEVVEAISSGFTSVMIDGSRLSFADNMALTRKVAEYARDRNVPVEAELGAVGRVDDATHEGAGHTDDAFTDPAQAAEFVEKTGCDFLAVAIGNAHGLYRKAPSLDFGCLAKIRAATSIPLVLHGGSGTPEDQLREAVSLGIAKVNVASEISRAFNNVYIPAMQTGKIWWAAAKRDALAAMRSTIADWIRVLGSEGKG